MNKIYRVIVFDWEGTLVEDLSGHIVYAIEKHAIKWGIELDDRNVLRDHLDLGLPRVIHTVFNKFSMHQQEDLLKEIQDEISIPLSYVCLMPGALDLVTALHKSGVGLAIATNKGHVSLQRVLLLSGLDEFFKVTCSAGQFPAKPCPEMLIDIMNKFGVSKNEMLMIGDSDTDIEMAREVDVDVIGLDVYHRNTIELQTAGAIQVFDSFLQIKNFLKGEINEGVCRDT